jgi:hypothetical protein
MSSQETTQRAPGERRGPQVWWATIAVFAVVIAFADGFWMTSLQGAVGAIERQGQTPTMRWLRDSTLMVPLFFVAVLAAILIARRVVGNRGGLVKFATTALLVTVLSSGVGAAAMTASSAYDYHLQTQHLQLEQHLGHTQLTAAAGPIAQSDAGTCTGICASERSTLHVHVRAVMYGSLVLLITNLVLVLWILALRSDRLWRRPDSEPMVTTTAVPQELSLV